MPSNSKGARPKTTSKSKKSTQETDVKKQLTLLIMNTNGPNNGKGTSERRKQTIIDVINRHNPDVALLQEFNWTTKPGQKWLTDAFPEYQIDGNKHASIMYNSNELILSECQIKLYRHESKHPKPDFDPIERMYLRVVKTKGVPFMEFICISWHGEHKSDRKVTEFKNLMILLNKMYVKFQLPILIAGDFNVKMKLIRHEVKDPFKLYEYKASERRKKKGVIDYFIATTELNLSDITPVDLNKYSKAEKPEEVLDHDPIKAMLKTCYFV